MIHVNYAKPYLRVVQDAYNYSGIYGLKNFQC